MNVELYVMMIRLLLVLLIFTACEKNLRFSPHEVRPDFEGLHAENIAWLQQLPEKDTFQFIVTGDTQLALDETVDFISAVNQRTDVEFVLLTGDLTEFGMTTEFNLLAGKLKTLNKPFFTAIGNHDMLANGREIFQRMFGPEEFGFAYGGSHFIFMNTNCRETNFDGSVPNVSILQHELGKSSEVNNVFFVSHVPPWSPDFDLDYEMEFISTLGSHPKARMSFHGHHHNFSINTPYESGLIFVVTDAISKRNYSLVRVEGESVSLQQVSF
jgi:hypothetical protein